MRTGAGEVNGVPADPTTARVLILGAIRGYQWSQVELFVKSLENTGFSGRCVLFTSCITPETITKLAAHGIETSGYRGVSNRSIIIGKLTLQSPQLTPITTNYRRGLKRLLVRSPALVGSRRLLRLNSALLPVTTARFLLYLDFLLRLPPAELPTYVILSDVRDVVFQRDPRHLEREAPTLTLSLEDESRRIGSCPFNSQWIQSGYGPGVLASLHDSPISCAGVTVGPTQQIIRYLQAMAREILAPALFPNIRHTVPDQGYHNYVAYSILSAQDTCFSPCGLGPVLTLGYVRNPTCDADGYLRNLDSTLPVIVHQYDRHAFLGPRIRKRLGLSQ